MKPRWSALEEDLEAIVAEEEANKIVSASPKLEFNIFIAKFFDATLFSPPSSIQEMDMNRQYHPRREKRRKRKRKRIRKTKKKRKRKNIKI